MEQPIDPRVQRLLNLVEDNLDGIAKTATKMGKRAQLFYNMAEGKSKFSIDTLTELAIAYPGRVDANYILFGKVTNPEQRESESNKGMNQSLEAVPVSVTATEFDVTEHPEYIRLAAKYDAAIDRIDRIESQFKDLAIQNGHNMDVIRKIAMNAKSFLESGSQPTAISDTVLFGQFQNLFDTYFKSDLVLKRYAGEVLYRPVNAEA